jgi:hypothetical protein
MAQPGSAAVTGRIACEVGQVLSQAQNTGVKRWKGMSVLQRPAAWRGVINQSYTMSMLALLQRYQTRVLKALVSSHAHHSKRWLMQNCHGNTAELELWLARKATSMT